MTPEETKEYNKRYQEQNKDKIVEQRKEYRAKNKEKIAQHKKEYYAQPDIKEKKSLREKERYQKDRDKVLLRQHKRRKDRLGFINKIALRYKCQNQSCQWNGEYEPCQLDFHHYDPLTKVTEIAKMLSWSYEKIIIEINKCIVLCRNCHAAVHRDIIQVDETMLCKVDDSDI